MLLSIIIPAYNAARSITDCIESIERNTSTDYEIVIIDDGSTDNQNEIIALLQKQFSNIRFYSQQNTGGLGARIYGFTKACGEYCTCVDADDFVSDNYVKVIATLVHDNPSANYFMLNNFRNDTAENVFTKERTIEEGKSVDKSWIVDKIIWGNEVAVWNKIYKTERAKKLYDLMDGYRNVIYCDDQLINVGYVALVRGGVQAIINDTAIYYHRRDLGVTSVQYSERQFNDLQVRIAFYYDKIEVLELNKKLRSKILYSYIRNIGGALRKFDPAIVEKNMSGKTREILRVIPRTIRPESPKDFMSLIYLWVAKIMAHTH